MTDDKKASTPAAQTLVTSRDFSTDKYRLLELNEEVEKAILAGEKVTIVGGANQRAALCTSSSSFFLSKEDTSNLRLLTSHTKWDAEQGGGGEIETVGSAAFHYVLQPKVPDVGQLKSLLLEAPYSKSQGSPSAKRAKLSKLYATAQLMAELQVSKRELEVMLEQLHAFEDAGKWRLLDPVYQTSIFGDILDAIIQNDWDFENNGVVVDELVAALAEPEIVVRQCCRVYGTFTPASDAGGERCVFDSKKIATFCAKQLFKERDEGHIKPQSLARSDEAWALDQFMEKWQLRVPEPIRVSEQLLRGIAIVKPLKGKPARLLFLAEDELPTDPKQRFDALFAFQEKWTVAQLEPYISALVRPGVTQASLLLKFARSSRQANSDERLYSKR